jgi:hypothetical protein
MVWNEIVGLMAREVAKDGSIPSINAPWPTKDVSSLHQSTGHPN